MTTPLSQPQFEHHQRPKTIAVIESAVGVRLKQLTYRITVKPLMNFCTVTRQGIPGKFAEFPPEPMIQWYTKAHFSSVPNFRGKKLSECILKDTLARTSTQLELSG